MSTTITSKIENFVEKAITTLKNENETRFSDIANAQNHQNEQIKTAQDDMIKMQNHAVKLEREVDEVTMEQAKQRTAHPSLGEVDKNASDY